MIPGRDEYGAETEVDGPVREVMANEKSVKGAEFYQAHAVGIRPEIVFEIRKAEYQGEPRVKYEGATYYVIRTYSRSGELLELTCSRYPMEG
ncbi:phage head closure protein [Paenibacillus harenae]|uniref:phage head closure protein n=1 Tax=Paenibacillus harenae TaxID=306543 RepID=UPI000566DAF5|nr:phage head closure protein [Paenibacillus harenae]